jgi:hypothetical protein
MKKTNIRVRRNGGSKAVSPQVPNKPGTKARRKSHPGGWDPKGVALVFMAGSEAGPEREIAGLNYSAAEFALIQRAAKASKVSLAALLANVISAGCKRILGESLPPLGNGPLRTITFTDGGQDFTCWVIDCHGKITDCAPAQGWVWIGGTVTNHRRLKVGGFAKWKKGDNSANIRYSVKTIQNGSHIGGAR